MISWLCLCQYSCCPGRMVSVMMIKWSCSDLIFKAWIKIGGFYCKAFIVFTFKPVPFTKKTKKAGYLFREPDENILTKLYKIMFEIHFFLFNTTISRSLFEDRPSLID